VGRGRVGKTKATRQRAWQAFRTAGARQVLNIDDRGDRSRTAILAIGFSCLILLFPLLPITFAQAHLLKHRPFRLADTVQSGGDHICDLRGNSDGNGKPERLGDYVTVSGTVIAGPSTYETGGWLFWLRQGACGVLVYGEQEVLAIGDSVEASGCLRQTNGNYFFPETGLATLGDLAIEDMGVARLGHSDNIEPVAATARALGCHPDVYAGNLVVVTNLRLLSVTSDDRGDVFARVASGSDSLNIYLDQDTGIPPDLDPRACYVMTGIMVKMKVPAAIGGGPFWCVAPRQPADIVLMECGSAVQNATWGGVKTSYRGGPGP
jgi:hypothetical protein